MKPSFTNSVLVKMSEQEMIDLRTAVSNMVWKFNDKTTEPDYIRYKKLQDDLDYMISKGLPF